MNVTVSDIEGVIDTLSLALCNGDRGSTERLMRMPHKRNAWTVLSLLWFSRQQCVATDKYTRAVSACNDFLRKRSTTMVLSGVPGHREDECKEPRMHTTPRTAHEVFGQDVTVLGHTDEPTRADLLYEEVGGFTMLSKFKPRQCLMRAGRCFVPAFLLPLGPRWWSMGSLVTCNSNTDLQRARAFYPWTKLPWRSASRLWYFLSGDMPLTTTSLTTAGVSVHALTLRIIHQQLPACISALFQDQSLTDKNRPPTEGPVFTRRRFLLSFATQLKIPAGVIAHLLQQAFPRARTKIKESDYRISNAARVPAGNCVMAMLPTDGKSFCPHVQTMAPRQAAQHCVCVTRGAQVDIEDLYAWGPAQVMGAPIRPRSKRTPPVRSTAAVISKPKSAAMALKPGNTATALKRQPKRYKSDTNPYSTVVSSRDAWMLRSVSSNRSHSTVQQLRSLTH